MAADIYGDWIFYGGLAAVIGMCITVYVLGTKHGVEYITGKRSAVIIAIFLFPSILLPLLLAPQCTVMGKIAITIGLTSFCVVRYLATTKSQEAIAKMRGGKKEIEKRQSSE